MDGLENLGFTEPTLIQKKSIPPALAGKNIVGQSQTGSGKTLAFGLPILQNVEPKLGLQALIITPTRELCLQVSTALKDVCKYSKIKCHAIYGGVQYRSQFRALKQVEIIVSTPGRLLDHIDKGTVDFSKIKFLVLDEVDKMLEMGFLDDVEQIIVKLPKKKQTMFYSATIPTQMKTIINQHIQKPFHLKTQNHVANHLLRQIYYETTKIKKFSILVHLLKANVKQKAIVFCATRHETDILSENLQKLNLKCMPLHGGYSQSKRLATVDEFRLKRVKLLIATDVAARGLDIKNISHIYNWDIPTPTDYIHRIGRTARAGNTGFAISLVTPRDKKSFEEIHKVQRKDMQKKVIKGLKKVTINRELKVPDLVKKDPKNSKKSFTKSRKGKNKSFNSKKKQSFTKMRKKGKKHNK